MSLTKSDLNQIKNLLDEQTIQIEAKILEVEEKFEAKLVEVKSDFYDKVDPILKEVTASREEREILSNKVYSDHEPRIEKVENKLSLTP